MRKLGGELAALVAVGIFAATILVPEDQALADAIDKVGKKLIKYQAEVKGLKSGIRRPSRTANSRDLVARRLIDAQVMFGVGNYDDAAVMLYDIVEKRQKNPSWHEALYYLAESLFQKGDNVGARSYFVRLVREAGTSSKYYQQALERLIELTLKLNDSEGIDEWLAAIDNVPASKLRPSVPYVRGKYSFYRENYDDAIKYFPQVPRRAKYYFQAQYFTGASHIAKGELGKATKLYMALVESKPKNNDDRRVIELSHMALGRIHYERDQPSKAIDRYLQINRRSDLFDEALFEVAWVYVKNKEYEKALRALELLALADPLSSKLPDVKILEGNLRIRKAQNVYKSGKGNAKEEYNAAIRVFEDTHTTFSKPKNELERLMKEHEDPRVFMAQITGRNSETFDVQSTLPEVAAAWLREEPDVKRVISIETDLGEIRDEINTAERTIERLEQALSSPSRVSIFPNLASKRTRSVEILDDLFAIRMQLATHERARIRKYANSSEKAKLAKLQARRQRIAKNLAKLPNATVKEGQRIEKARQEYVTLDQRTAEVSTVIDTTEAQLVALEKYIEDVPKLGGKPLEDVKEINKAIASLRRETNSMRQELRALRSEATLAKDRAGTGDEVAMRRKKLRTQLRAALDDEHRAYRNIIRKMSGKDRTKADQIANLTTVANSITVELDEINATIDAIVDTALVEVRSDLLSEKANLSAYKKEFLNYEAESRTLGGEILSGGFAEVAKKFYDILIRADVGVVDVAWSLKESADRLSKRLTLDQARERKTLDADFADVIRELRESKVEELFKKASGRE